jgi:hypothetical protein
LLLMKLCESDDPSGRLVAAAWRGFMQIECLYSAGEREEEQRRCDEYTEIEMDLPGEFESICSEGHRFQL